MKKLIIAPLFLYTFCVLSMEPAPKNTYIIDLVITSEYKKQESSSQVESSQCFHLTTRNITFVLDTTVAHIKAYALQQNYLKKDVKKLYVTYAAVKNGCNTFKTKELPDDTYVIGILQRYKKPFLTSFVWPDSTLTPYQRPEITPFLATTN